MKTYSQLTKDEDDKFCNLVNMSLKKAGSPHQLVELKQNQNGKSIKFLLISHPQTRRLTNYSQLQNDIALLNSLYPGLFTGSSKEEIDKKTGTKKTYYQISQIDSDKLVEFQSIKFKDPAPEQAYFSIDEKSDKNANNKILTLFAKAESLKCPDTVLPNIWDDMFPLMRLFYSQCQDEALKNHIITCYEKRFDTWAEQKSTDLFSAKKTNPLPQLINVLDKNANPIDLVKLLYDFGNPLNPLLSAGPHQFDIPKPIGLQPQ